MKKISIYITAKMEYKEAFQLKYAHLRQKLTDQKGVLHNGGMENTLIKVVVDEAHLKSWIAEMEMAVKIALGSVNPYDAIEVSSSDFVAEKLLEESKRKYSFFEAFGEDCGISREKKDSTKKQEVKENQHEMMVKFSPQMQAYVEELKHVTETLHSVKSLTQFFETSLLVSIDEGYGYSSFIQVISDYLDKYYSSPIKKERIYKTEIASDKGISAWKREVETIRRISEEMKRENGFTIKTYDMRDWMDVFTDSNFFAILRDMAQSAKNVLLVFRISYIEEERLEMIKDNLSNVISLRSVSIPPISIENMAEYLKQNFQEDGFTVQDACDDLLEEWISQEKSDGLFYGYKTLEKMAAELIYQKALLVKSAEKSSEFTKNILPADIKNMLNAPIETVDAYELLDSMIGLDEIKSKVREMVAQIKMQKSMLEKGVDLGKPSMHMLFLGNPGTGKTTVARYLGKIFRQEGLLSKGLFVEKTGSDFVDNKVGTLAQKVRGYCRDSYGSIMFIDEAYAMSVGHSSGNITDETVPILVTEMENNRDKLCVIFAGYDEEMKEFLKSNSGLDGRISHTFVFPNYSREELVEIFFHMIKDKFEYEEGFRDVVKEYMQSITDEALSSREFSNARFVRNLFERVWAKTAYRASFTDDKSMILKKEDFKAAIEEADFQEVMSEKKAEKRIGFVAE